MRKILLLLIIALGITSCKMDNSDSSSVENKEKFYYDFDVELMHKEIIGGKMSHKIFLIRLVDDTTLYREIGHSGSLCLTDQQYYSYEVGDILHYDYMRRDLFFKKTIK